MTTREDDGVPHVALLLFCHSAHPGCEGERRLYENDEVDIGRRFIEQTWNIPEPTISSHHLRFHCVVFKDEGGPVIPPLVYVRVLSSNPATLLQAGSESKVDGRVIRSSHRGTLLCDGDILQLTPYISVRFCGVDCAHPYQNHLSTTCQVEAKRFANQYHLTDRILGAGGFASVFLAVERRTQRQVACKIISTSVKAPAITAGHLRDHDVAAEQATLALSRKRENLAREYKILKGLSHPNIISIEKVFSTPHNLYIFQELVTGGDLLSYMEKIGALSEPQAAIIVRQILKAVDYLHDSQIVHRDIKPENVLMTSWRVGARVILTDFGQAKALRNPCEADQNSTMFRMRSLVGTIGYQAPEMTSHALQLDPQNSYSTAVDIWSIGCVTANLLTMESLFDCDEVDRLASAYSNFTSLARNQAAWLGVLDHEVVWRNISRKAKSFIKNCLVLSEAQRMTAKQALLHDWFANKYHAAEIEAAYQRAITDWRPRDTGVDSVEIIDTTSILCEIPKLGYVDRIARDAKSRYFGPSKQHQSAICKRLIYPSPLDHEHTPLPGISETSEAKSIKCPASAGTSRRETFPTKSVCVPKHGTANQGAFNQRC